jgi:hypothetical protein
MIIWAERAKAAISQTGLSGTAKTDETVVLRLLAVSSVPSEAVSSLPGGLSTVLAVPCPAILEKHDSSIAVIEDPDRWCWPHSAAMNGQEIDSFMARLARFKDKGLTLAQAEQVADRLVIRDREGDDRALCLECIHLLAHGRWRCGNWVAAAVAQSDLARDLVKKMQRCSGLLRATNNRT